MSFHSIMATLLITNELDTLRSWSIECLEATAMMMMMMTVRLLHQHQHQPAIKLGVVVFVVDVVAFVVDVAMVEEMELRGEMEIPAAEVMLRGALLPIPYHIRQWSIRLWMKK
mmetsp:Transcript_28358/g.80607  ORF Transcript_28358/g.80607 Transcript_28358/m.80607 type:complete len:113 (-) Transcript_28358:545-883(-)